jgi:DNA repair exonuclease SbcCD ATPase subunit
MKIFSCHAENFGSYKSLDFEFNAKGLTLISGPTGAGKSTLCDLVPWALFGVTAKGGKVDDILSWSGGTTSSLILTDKVNVFRSRAPNDLYYTMPGTLVQFRGKDLQDTQKLINELLGMDADTYLASAYLHEFSLTNQFFITSAKNRRQLTEQVADLTLATTLTKKTAEYKKTVKKESDGLLSSLELKKNDIKHCRTKFQEETAQLRYWEENKVKRLSFAKHMRDNYDKELQRNLLKIKEAHYLQVAQLEDEMFDLMQDIKPVEFFKEEKEKVIARKVANSGKVCAECGAPKDLDKQLLILKEENRLDRDEAANTQKKVQLTRAQGQYKRLQSALEPKLKQEMDRPNAYATQVKDIEAEKNPFNPDKFEKILKSEQAELDELTVLVEDLNQEMNDLELLTDALEIFRTELIRDTVTELETGTNTLLNDYFDSEIRIELAAQESDKLEVTIFKDGNTAVFTQLSKGQRRILTLCFGLSVMKCIQNRHGIDINCIFLDECCEGLSEELKLKVFNLLQKLETEYSSVFVTEHSQELKNRFLNKIEVSLVNGESQLE